MLLPWYSVEIANKWKKRAIQTTNNGASVDLHALSFADCKFHTVWAGACKRGKNTCARTCGSERAYFRDEREYVNKAHKMSDDWCTKEHARYTRNHPFKSKKWVLTNTIVKALFIESLLERGESLIERVFFESMLEIFFGEVLMSGLIGGRHYRNNPQFNCTKNSQQQWLWTITILNKGEGWIPHVVNVHRWKKDDETNNQGIVIRLYIQSLVYSSLSRVTSAPVASSTSLST